MKTPKDPIDYRERLSRVTAFIYDHLDEEIDLAKLADIACLSPYHWHRVYHAMNGETIAATVKRLRLHRAAGFLAHTAMPIDAIAEKSGYGSLQSFTRAFGAAYCTPPAQYRKAGAHAQFQSLPREGSSAMYDIAIRTTPATAVVGIDHVGSYMEIGRAFDTLYGWLGARALLRPELRSIGLYYDDPSTVPEAQLRSRACVIIDEPLAFEAPLLRGEIPAGRHAVLRHKGPYATMKAAYQWLYGDWLVQSGEATANAPVFEEYLNSPRDTAPSDLLTDVYLPLTNASSAAGR